MQREEDISLYICFGNKTNRMTMRATFCENISIDKSIIVDKNRSLPNSR